jgi:hypothetical protein
MPCLYSYGTTPMPLTGAALHDQFIVVTSAAYGLISGGD